ncbi:MAG: LysM peptidoglycan-binding domain-containing protein [Symploca sp. SIO1C2]|nr:LysM peptidoglycan-binding domain-containing protein [Symploca sp. SIO1C2]
MIWRGTKRNFGPWLEKLTITALSSVKEENRIISRKEEGSFVVMFNPESYSLKYVNQHSKYQGINTTGRTPQYSLSQPEELSLTLIFDGTDVTNYLTSQSRLGGIGNTALNTLGTAVSVGPFSRLVGQTDVYKRVQEFLDLTVKLNGKTHEPNFLEVVWGDLIFNCKLQTVDVKYTLFTRSGQPLRAELGVVFIGSISDKKRVRGDNLQSPDMTHVREVKNSDTLPLIAQEVYEDSAYYIQLARANNLNSFRQLKPGTTIKLPPIKK